MAEAAFIGTLTVRTACFRPKDFPKAFSPAGFHS
jgi:hypothetical protein